MVTQFLVKWVILSLMMGLHFFHEISPNYIIMSRLLILLGACFYDMKDMSLFIQLAYQNAGKNNQI